MASYDHDWCGIGHPNHPANEKMEPENILVCCDGCDELTPENEIVEDGDWYWCPACWADILQETKAPVTELSRSAEAIQ